MYLIYITILRPDPKCFKASDMAPHAVPVPMLKTSQYNPEGKACMKLTPL